MTHSRTLYIAPSTIVFHMCHKFLFSISPHYTFHTRDEIRTNTRVTTQQRPRWPTLSISQRDSSTLTLCPPQNAPSSTVSLPSACVLSMSRTWLYSPALSHSMRLCTVFLSQVRSFCMRLGLSSSRSMVLTLAPREMADGVSL